MKLKNLQEDDPFLSDGDRNLQSEGDKNLQTEGKKIQTEIQRKNSEISKIHIIPSEKKFNSENNFVTEKFSTLMLQNKMKKEIKRFSLKKLEFNHMDNKKEGFETSSNHLMEEGY
jgi:hypothetical protein